MACEFFLQKLENAFFGIISKFNFRNPFSKGELIFSVVNQSLHVFVRNVITACVILSVILMGLSLENRETKKNCKYI
jgi:hypothetical protein